VLIQWLLGFMLLTAVSSDFEGLYLCATVQNDSHQNVNHRIVFVESNEARMHEVLHAFCPSLFAAKLCDSLVRQGSFGKAPRSESRMPS